MAEQQLKPVAKATADKKPTALQKAADNFISKDSKQIGDYLLNDIIVPALKDTLSKVVKGGVDTLLYGMGGNPNNKQKSGTSTISYRSFYEQPARRPNPQDHAVYEYRDISFETRSDAEKVINQLMDIIDVYGRASVAQYFELAEITPSQTDYAYGWTNLLNANVYRTLTGRYKIELPQAQVIK